MDCVELYRCSYCRCYYCLYLLFALALCGAAVITFYVHLKLNIPCMLYIYYSRILLQIYCICHCARLIFYPTHILPAGLLVRCSNDQTAAVQVISLAVNMKENSVYFSLSFVALTVLEEYNDSFNHCTLQLY